MKKNYKQLVNIMLAMLISIVGYGQNIKLSIANAQNTNDGTFDYYEADVMIQTIGGQADFKLGSGQLYLNYNTNAFGTNVVNKETPADNRFEVSADYNAIDGVDEEDYFLGEKSGFTSFYNISDGANNSDSRVSWDFDQGVSSGAMTQLVSATQRKLVHFKIKYIDVNQDPMITFEAEAQVPDSRDQFYTACGPFDAPDTNLDCTSGNPAGSTPENVNIQFQDAEFDSSESTLSNNDINKVTQFSIYPNPSKGLVFVEINKTSDYLVFDMIGKQIMKGSFKQGMNELQLKNYDSGVYFLKVIDNAKVITKRIVLE